MCSNRSTTSNQRTALDAFGALHETFLVGDHAREAAALVTEQLTFPMSSVGMAPQFTAMNGPSARGAESWMSRTTSSLPVPDSPKMCTGA